MAGVIFTVKTITLHYTAMCLDDTWPWLLQSQSLGFSDVFLEKTVEAETHPSHVWHGGHQTREASVVGKWRDSLEIIPWTRIMGEHSHLMETALSIMGNMF